MDDICIADDTKCYHDEYAEMCWAVWDTVTADTATSEDEWTAAWAKKTSAKFNIPESAFTNLWNRSKDTHNSNIRVREYWKYGSSIGVAGTPVGFINGVMLDSTPTTLDGWKTVFESFFTPPTLQDP